MKEIKYKKIWKEPNASCKELNPLQYMKAKVLNPWEQLRVNIPERTYERYPVSKAIKFQTVSKEFGYDNSGKGTGKHYQKFLKEHKEKFNVKKLKL